MIREPRLGRDVEHIAPDAFARPDPGAEQRFDAVQAKEIQRFGRAFRRKAGVAPGIGGQFDGERHRRAEIGVAVQVRPQRQRLGRERGGGRLDPRVLFERRHHPGADAQRVETVDHVVLQDGTRGDFDKDAAACLRQRVDRLSKANGLARVAPPVFGVERDARRLAPRCRRNIGGVAGTGPQPLKVGDQLGANRLHARRMVGIVDIEQLGRHAPFAGELGEGFQRVDRACDCAGSRAVVAGDGDRLVAELLQRGLSRFGPGEDRRHAARALHHLQRGGAGAHQVNRVLQRQNTGAPCGGDFADRMAGDGVGAQALRLQ